MRYLLLIALLIVVSLLPLTSVHANDFGCDWVNLYSVSDTGQFSARDCQEFGYEVLTVFRYGNNSFDEVKATLKVGANERYYPDWFGDVFVARIVALNTGKDKVVMWAPGQSMAVLPQGASKVLDVAYCRSTGLSVLRSSGLSNEIAYYGSAMQAVVVHLNPEEAKVANTIDCFGDGWLTAGKKSSGATAPMKVTTSGQTSFFKNMPQGRLRYTVVSEANVVYGWGQDPNTQTQTGIHKWIDGQNPQNLGNPCVGLAAELIHVADTYGILMASCKLQNNGGMQYATYAPGSGWTILNSSIGISTHLPLSWFDYLNGVEGQH